MTIQEIVDGLQSDDPNSKFLAAQNARKILSEEKFFPPIDSFIDAGGVPNLISCLKCHDNVPLQFEACQALAYIASGTSLHTETVVAAGAIPFFIDFLGSLHISLAEQAVWALGNIAGDCPELRDLVINHGVVPPLLSLLTLDISTVFRRDITWTLLNLCRGTPDPPFEVTKSCLPAFAILISHPDPETVTNALWAISYLTDGTNEKIQKTIEAGVVPRLVELLSKKEVAIIEPAIQSIVNITKGSNSQIQAVIDANVLTPLKQLFTHEKRGIRDKVCWIVSNITAGSSNQIQAVIDHGIMGDIINTIYYSSDLNAAQAVANLTVGVTLDQIMYLVQADIIPSLFNLLSDEDPKILTLLLDAITNILNASITVNAVEVVCFFIELCDGLVKLENLLEHENEDVCTSAYHIIKLTLKPGDESENTYFTDKSQSNV